MGGETSGGCRNFLETFIHNPQFLVSVEPGGSSGHPPQVTLEDVDEEDDEPLCTLIVSLMQVRRNCSGSNYMELRVYHILPQKGRRALRHEGVSMLSIGGSLPP